MICNDEGDSVEVVDLLGEMESSLFVFVRNLFCMYRQLNTSKPIGILTLAIGEYHEHL